MSRLKISDPAKELTYFREPLEGWLRLDNCDDGHFPLVFILAPPEAPSQVLLGRKKRGFGRDRYVLLMESSPETNSLAFFFAPRYMSCQAKQSI